MKDEMIQESRRCMEKWDYSQKDIDFFIRRIDTLTLNGEEVKEFFISNGAETEPDRYSDDVIDLVFVTNKRLYIMEFDGSNLKSGTKDLEGLNRANIEESDQRIIITFRFEVVQDYAKIATYDEERFDEAYKFYHKVMGLKDEK